MQRRTKITIKIPRRQRRWRVQNAEDDELDETLLGFGAEKETSSAE
jgi:hypothetical protein